MKYVIDIPEDVIQRYKDGLIQLPNIYGMQEIIDSVKPLDSVVEEYVERGAVIENMRMLDKIDSIKAEISEPIQGDCYFIGKAKVQAETIKWCLEIIDKHISGKE